MRCVGAHILETLVALSLEVIPNSLLPSELEISSVWTTVLPHHISSRPFEDPMVQI
jgi:hypothetical protein